jgi:hypothetical protein
MIMKDLVLSENIPDTYRFYFQSQDGALSTQTIYFERHANWADSNNESFLGSIEFVATDTLNSCFNLIYLSEKQKIDVFAGFIEEPDDESPFEFSTVFTSGDIGYSHYHLVGQTVSSSPFHVTLLRGFNDRDIENIRNFGQRLNIKLAVNALVVGEIIDIIFDPDSIKDRVGRVHYLN